MAVVIISPVNAEKLAIVNMRIMVLAKLLSFMIATSALMSGPVETSAAGA